MFLLISALYHDVRLASDKAWETNVSWVYLSEVPSKVGNDSGNSLLYNSQDSVVTPLTIKMADDDKTECTSVAGNNVANSAWCHSYDL
jgi:hypothetical protein